ncbi:MAG: MCE family protein, partial [Verrucomicrobiota bacterium]|nr:MCE family protein [Verrucomicrobiota bacterium]
MNNAQMTARVGLFFIVGAVLIWITFEALHSGGFHRRAGYTLVASFADLKDLKPGDEVRMAGVSVGSVEQTRLANGRAQAVLRIAPDIKVPNDATASITTAGLLGTNYIAFDLGHSAEPYPPDAEVRTRPSADLNTVMTQLSDLGSKLNDTFGSISEITKGKNGQPGLFQRLDKLVADNSDNITTTIHNLQEITTKVNRGEGTIGRLVNDPKLHDDLLAAVDQIKDAAIQTKSFVSDAQSIIGQVKSGQGALGTLIYDKQAGENLKRVAQNLRELSDKLNHGQGTLGRLINDDSLYTQAQGVLKRADQAVDSLSDSSAISAVG